MRRVCRVPGSHKAGKLHSESRASTEAKAAPSASALPSAPQYIAVSSQSAAFDASGLGLADRASHAQCAAAGATT